VDQNTVITLAVVGGVAFLLLVCLLLFVWRASNQLARRRFNPSQQFIAPQWAQPQVAPQGNQSRGCECPPKRGPECVPARVGDVEDVPHAIYGLAAGDGCGGGGKLTRAEIQTLVNELNAVQAAEDRKRLFERLAGVLAQG